MSSRNVPRSSTCFRRGSTANGQSPATIAENSGAGASIRAANQARPRAAPGRRTRARGRPISKLRDPAPLNPRAIDSGVDWPWCYSVGGCVLRKLWLAATVFLPAMALAPVVSSGELGNSRGQ